MKGILEEVRHSASELVLCCVSSLDRSVVPPALMASSYCTSRRARSHSVGRAWGDPPFFPPQLLFFQQVSLKCCKNFAGILPCSQRAAPNPQLAFLCQDFFFPSLKSLGVLISLKESPRLKSPSPSLPPPQRVFISRMSLCISLSPAVFCLFP